MALLDCLANLVFHDEGEPRELRPLKLLYILQFLAFATQMFFPMFYDGLHFTKFEIGVIQTVRCTTGFLGPSIWGMIADALGNQRRVHIFCCVAATVCAFCIRFVTSFWAMCILVFLSFLHIQPSFSLLDQVALCWLDKCGGEYGKQRLYGAVGWGLGGALVGAVVNVGGIEWTFNIMLIFSLISMYILINYIPTLEDIDRMKPNADTMRLKPAAATTEKESFCTSFMKLITSLHIVVFFLLVLIVGVMAGIITSFLLLYLFNLSHGNSNLIGIAVFLETFSELPVFFYSNALIDRFGESVCILIGLLGFGLRLMAYVVLNNPWFILPAELLHSTTFGLTWSTFTHYVYHVAPRGTQSTMIGLLLGIQDGMGAGIGTLAGGYIYEVKGPKTMWLITVLGVPLSVFLLLVFSVLSSRAAAREHKGDYESVPTLETTFKRHSSHNLVHAHSNSALNLSNLDLYEKAK